MAEAMDYGIDVSMFVNGQGPPDLDPNFRLIDGPEAVAQNVALRCNTQREGPGALLGAENDGLFLPNFANATITPDVLMRVKTLVGGEARKDERVGAATVSATADLAQQRIIVDVDGRTDTEAPFSLTLSVDKVSVELLQNT
jgi:hypothetical protein